MQSGFSLISEHMSQPKSTVPFGFRDVGPDEKPALVQGVFSSVARRYDLMNDLMSFRVHRIWKDEFITWLDPRPGMSVLDVAGGTGDISARIHARVQRRGGEAEITVCDLSLAMLEQGVTRPGAEHLRWVCGDAERLPVASGSMDAYTIAFGIRNTTHLDRVLQEAHRVLKAGGRFLCLEFSKVTVPGLDALYDLYSFSVLPRLGEVVAGDGAAYRYLAESIRRFPGQRSFAAAIQKAGFSQVKYRNLSGGIAAIHSGWKL
jgi:demethylmenaquinone methyltransferase/2-methoxy-6-polyprenyl-1,4-benzoquinol methylase